ncbi:DUF1707 domain-containing protein [Mycobacteroides chelonae]|uniref:DUF1707 SHOCT-like domain-containing protein n=1 Tax=Mycobacteroides chelonae TaxID=1774 RepID=UPI0019112317|nr:DUF1707 domain-containing protein [Mycobacteroides chelonae]QQG96723.1 DUF1707 domain-containing protein [Mycobacteroides chelonae]
MDAEADPVRARDLDRLDVMAALDTALADGQLHHAEYRERVQRAQSASTLRELAAITADLQPHTVAVPAPAPARRRRWLLVAASALTATGVAVTAFFAVDAASTHQAAPTAMAPAESVSPLVSGALLKADGLREITSATLTRFHTTVVLGVHIYGDSAQLHMLDPSSPSGLTYYDYSAGGRFHNPQVYGGTSVNSGHAGPIDLARLNVDAVAALISSAPERLGLTTANVGNDHFRVTIGGDDGGEIWMGVNNNGLDSHLVADLTGTIKGIHRCQWGC